MTKAQWLMNSSIGSLYLVASENGLQGIFRKKQTVPRIKAVGGANGKNPLCIIVPCHRVIANNGSLGGYSGGLEMKHRLLSLETSK